MRRVARTAACKAVRSRAGAGLVACDALCREWSAGALPGAGGCLLVTDGTVGRALRADVAQNEAPHLCRFHPPLCSVWRRRTTALLGGPGGDAAAMDVGAHMRVLTALASVVRMVGHGC